MTFIGEEWGIGYRKLRESKNFYFFIIIVTCFIYYYRTHICLNYQNYYYYDFLFGPRYIHINITGTFQAFPFISVIFWTCAICLIPFFIYHILKSLTHINSFTIKQLGTTINKYLYLAFPTQAVHQCHRNWIANKFNVLAIQFNGTFRCWIYIRFPTGSFKFVSIRLMSSGYLLFVCVCVWV